jgi:hypothetical protein
MYSGIKLRIIFVLFGVIGIFSYQYYEHRFKRITHIHVIEFHQYEQVIKNKASETKTIKTMLETDIGRFRLSDQLARNMKIGRCYEVLLTEEPQSYQDNSILNLFSKLGRIVSFRDKDPKYEGLIIAIERLVGC